MTNQREVEIRFKLTSDQREEILTKLKQRGWKSQAVYQKDVYFCDRSFIDAGNEKDCPYIVRIRESDKQAKLTYKSFTGDESWMEHETGIEDPQVTAKILEGTGLGAYLTISKHRLVGALDSLELTVDAIDLLGDFMEMEILTDKVEVGRARLMQMAEELGLPSEQVITKGYVQLMEEQLNRV